MVVADDDLVHSQVTENNLDGRRNDYNLIFYYFTNIIQF